MASRKVEDEVSDEEEKQRKKPVGGFEQGLKSMLEKAPGLAVPAWSTMQTAMAGGVAGGAAAASWRWIIGPVAGAAMIGGALWFTESGKKKVVEEVTSDQEMTEAQMGPEEDAAFLDAQTALMAAQEAMAHQAAGLTDENASSPVNAANSAEALDTEAQTAAPIPTPIHEAERAVPVPKDWADLPDEKAAGFNVDVSAACVGTEIGFRMARPLIDVRVLWNFGDGQFSSLAEPHHVFKAPGTYDITLSVTRISDGLIRTRTIENLVTIHPRPEADFTWEVPATAEALPRIALRDRSRDAASSTWVVDGESALAGESVALELPRVGEHRIQLVASSPEGCQSVTSHEIQVGNRFGLGASARFSPNGDGRYDTFFPRKLMSEDLSFVFRVEDNTGHIVHETMGLEPWLGTLPDGEMALPGAEFRWTAILQGEVGPAYFSDVVVVE